MSRILMFDTTLRDGEQSPGASMIASEKVRMAHELAELRVDVIEAGFAASGPDEVDAIRRIGRDVRGPVIAALARATEGDVREAARALEHAERPRIHVFLATSDLHLEHKLRMTRGECLERAERAVELARSLVDDVEFSAEDATRTDLDFLCRVVEGASAAGASTINVPDTVGYALPHEITHMVETLLHRIPALRDRVLSVHCHDDLGLAVANSLAGVAAGARQVECTINGIGERSGNASLEEIVMALRVRREDTGHETAVRHDRLFRASRLLSHLTGITPQPNKAIVGKNAFSHEAGIHQHGVLANRRTYEIMTPEMVGAPSTSLVLGKHSGRHGLEARYRALGYDLTPEELDRVSRDFKRLAVRKDEILDEDLLSLLHHGAMDDVPEVHRIESLTVSCGGEESVAELTATGSGVPRSATGTGDGPIAAAFAAAEDLFDFRVKLETLRIRAATPGRDALGEVAIRASVDGHTLTGRGASTDVVRASLQAYFHVINKAEAARKLEERHLTTLARAWGV